MWSVGYRVLATCLSLALALTMHGCGTDKPKGPIVKSWEKMGHTQQPAKYAVDQDLHIVNFVPSEHCEAVKVRSVELVGEGQSARWQYTVDRDEEDGWISGRFFEEELGVACISVKAAVGQEVWFRMDPSARECRMGSVAAHTPRMPNAQSGGNDPNIYQVSLPGAEPEVFLEARAMAMTEEECKSMELNPFLQRHDSRFQVGGRAVRREFDTVHHCDPVTILSVTPAKGIIQTMYRIKTSDGREESVLADSLSVECEELFADVGATVTVKGVDGDSEKCGPKRLTEVRTRSVGGGTKTRLEYCYAVDKCLLAGDLVRAKASCFFGDAFAHSKQRKVEKGLKDAALLQVSERHIRSRNTAKATGRSLAAMQSAGEDLAPLLNSVVQSLTQ